MYQWADAHRSPDPAGPGGDSYGLPGIGPHVVLGEDVLDLRYYHFRRLELDGIPVILTRTGWTSRRNFPVMIRDRSRRSSATPANCSRT